MFSEEPHDGERYFKFLFENMLEGYAFCEMVFDDSGKPSDFIYRDVNKSFERLTGLKDVIGKKVSEIIPDIQKTNPKLFEIYGRVAQTGKPETIEAEIKQLGIWLKISVYSPEKGYFVAVFDDISNIKNAIVEQEKRTAELELMNKAMVGREIKMAELKKRILELQAKLAECHCKE